MKRIIFAVLIMFLFFPIHLAYSNQNSLSSSEVSYFKSNIIKYLTYLQTRIKVIGSTYKIKNEIIVNYQKRFKQLSRRALGDVNKIFKNTTGNYPYVLNMDGKVYRGRAEEIIYLLSVGSLYLVRDYVNQMLRTNKSIKFRNYGEIICREVIMREKGLFRSISRFPDGRTIAHEYMECKKYYK